MAIYRIRKSHKSLIITINKNIAEALSLNVGDLVEIPDSWKILKKKSDLYIEHLAQKLNENYNPNFESNSNSDCIKNNISKSEIDTAVNPQNKNKQGVLRFIKRTSTEVNQK